MARIISVALPKGGVGKTTTAVNLAASLAVAEQRTLLIDMDTFGASALSLGFTEGSIRAGLYEVFNFITGIQNAIHRTELKFLDFIPANVRSMQMEERIIRVADNRGILRNALRSVAEAWSGDPTAGLRGCEALEARRCRSAAEHGAPWSEWSESDRHMSGVEDLVAELLSQDDDDGTLYVSGAVSGSSLRRAVR